MQNDIQHVESEESFKVNFLSNNVSNPEVGWIVFLSLIG